ncbi:putative Mitochondrial resolvase Ydc2 catalytic domain-containing protein [Seiridium cardinale]
MPPAFKLTQPLKLADLKTLAIACGVASSGTKVSLVQRLELSVRDFTRIPIVPTPNQRILSIDMGIRNLAFSLLIPPPDSLDRMRVGVRTPLPGVALKSWSRMVLANPATTESSSVEEDLWSPGNMAGMTLKLVQDQLLNFSEPPTHILIERQRFRSGGGAAVQEWTLRVNTLEAMIYSTLNTLKKCGHWQGDIIPISPKRVGPFWIEDTAIHDAAEPDGKEPKSRKNAKARHKKAKIDLVGNWLLDGKITPTDQAQVVSKSYLDRWQGKRAKKPSTEAVGLAGEPLQKLDDLADCLLQGLAWLKWQDNKRLLARDGPEALLGTGTRPS